MKKSTLRAEMRRLTAALDPRERLRSSREAVRLLLSAIDASGARTVALFSPLPDEIDIRPLFPLLGGRRIVLPRVEDTPQGQPHMEFYDYVCGDTARGAYGIEEPRHGPPCPPSAIDLMVVPAVAFARDGSRLGRGKGYYDRYMARDGFRAARIGVCFAHQLLDTLPSEPHDMRVDTVITPEA